MFGAYSLRYKYKKWLQYPKIDINHSNVPLIKFKIDLKNFLWVKTHIICSKIRYIAIFIVQIPNIYKV